MIEHRAVPSIRTSTLNQAPINPAGDYVIYWMVAQRRLTWNFALQRAVERSLELNKPLLIFEPLRLGYQWASARLHQFILEGMREHEERARERGVVYFPYVESVKGEGSGLLRALCERACLVVTDEYPCFFIPRMTRAAAERASVLFEQVDSNGLLPLRGAERTFTTAASFRRHLQKTLLPFFATDQFPMVDPLAQRELNVEVLGGAELPPNIYERWPHADLEGLLTGGLSRLVFDHQVEPVDQGGARAAAERLDVFMDQRLHRYHTDRNQLERGAASGLSAHLHFGHISTHEIAQRVFESCDWSPERVAPKPTGSREGWWGAPSSVESFIDELVTWRELGFVFTSQNPDTYQDYESLPSWALKTLSEHETDPRPHLYTLDELERGLTHEPIWNAAQQQLISEGRIHNYVRMLWGKKVLEWSPTPREALERLIYLNNKYALDGRDPNSYSGIFWCFGRFDRAWGPERPIFGKIRFMSAASTMRKLKAKPYVARYAPRDPELF